MDNKLVETSIISRKNAMVVALAVALFLAMALLSLYGWYKGFPPKPLEVFIELMFAVVLIERAGGKYTYELDKKVLRITKVGFFGGTRSFEIPYRDIMGIYRYKAKLLGVIKFRRTYRLQSALDGRAVWTVAYTASGRKGKMENQRVYFKPSKDMLDALQEKLPAKVRISEEEVVTRQFTKEK